MVPLMAETLVCLVGAMVTGQMPKGEAQAGGGETISYPPPEMLAKWIANGVVFYRAEEVCAVMPSTFYDTRQPEGARLASALRARMQTAFATFERR